MPNFADRLSWLERCPVDLFLSSGVVDRVHHVVGCQRSLHLEHNVAVAHYEKAIREGRQIVRLGGDQQDAGTGRGGFLDDPQ